MVSSVVYYKLKSAKNYKSLAIDGRFITVGQFKQEIYDIKRRGGRGTDHDLVVTNAQTNEEYRDEEMPIQRCTSLLLQRLPRHPRIRIVVERAVTDNKKSIVKINTDDNAQASSATSAVTSNDLDWDDFGDDPFAVPAPETIQSSIPALANNPRTGIRDEDKLIKGVELVQVRFEKKTPPEGYICHRCKVPGHLIQHCPTNGDPTFDVKRVKSPSGIPKSKLVASPDGPRAEIEGMPSTRSVCVLPPELHCPVCNEVMKDAVLIKCCFTSFCDRCIRDHTISKSMCVCGATNILADDIFPNKTLRDTINRILESSSSSDEYSVGRSQSSQVQDMESYNPEAKVPSPTQSVASKEQKVVAQVLFQRDESSKISEHVSEDEGRTLKVSDAPAAIRNSRVSNKAVSQNSSLVEHEVQHGPEHCTMMDTRSVTFGPYWNRTRQPGFMPLYPGSVPMELSKLATGLNAETPITSRKQFETRRTDLKRKCESGFPELTKRSKQCC